MSSDSPKSFTLHGKMIVSPITALYKCPFVMNFGGGVGMSLGVYIPALLLWHNPVMIMKKKKEAYKDIKNSVAQPMSLCVCVVVRDEQKNVQKFNLRNRINNYQLWMSLTEIFIFDIKNYKVTLCIVVHELIFARWTRERQLWLGHFIYICPTMITNNFINFHFIS